MRISLPGKHRTCQRPYPGSPTHSSPLETQPHLWVCYRSYTIPTALVRNSCKINDACYRHGIMTNDGTFAKQKTVNKPNQEVPWGCEPYSPSALFHNQPKGLHVLFRRSGTKLWRCVEPSGNLQKPLEENRINTRDPVSVESRGITTVIRFFSTRAKMTHCTPHVYDHCYYSFHCYFASTSTPGWFCNSVITPRCIKKRLCVKVYIRTGLILISERVWSNSLSFLLVLFLRKPN